MENIMENIKVSDTNIRLYAVKNGVKSSVNELSFNDDYERIIVEMNLSSSKKAQEEILLPIKAFCYFTKTPLSIIDNKGLPKLTLRPSHLNSEKWAFISNDEVRKVVSEFEDSIREKLCEMNSFLKGNGVNVTFELYVKGITKINN